MLRVPTKCFIVGACFALLCTTLRQSMNFVSEGYKTATILVEDKSGTESKYQIPSSSRNTCLSLDFDGDLDKILAEKQLVFVGMMAKAAGASLKHFSHECMRVSNRAPPHKGDVFGEDMNKEVLLMKKLEQPTLITAHIPSAERLAEITKYANMKHSLFVFSYREEADRIMSAIGYVVNTRICGSSEFRKALVSPRNRTHCVVSEGQLVQIIKNRKDELKLGSELLSCEVYDAIAANHPNMVFLNFKQTGKLQNLIAKHHCPQLTNSTVTINVGGKLPSSGSFVTKIQLQQQPAVFVPLEEWLNAKSHTIEYLLRMRSQSTCLGKTVKMSEQLLSCPDEALLVKSGGVREWY